MQFFFYIDQTQHIVVKDKNKTQYIVFYKRQAKFYIYVKTP